jgi:hypothetical protein
MSATLFAIVLWQGASGLAFQPGYASKEECQAVYQGPHVICWEYDPKITTWTAFFRTTEGPGSPKGFGAIWRFPNESTCRDYINALKPESFGTCRQLPHPEPCPVACKVSETPPPPPPSPVTPPVTPPPKQQSAPEQKPDPLLIRDRDSHEPSFSNRPIVAASVSAPARPKRVAIRQTRKPPQFDPIGALVALFTPRDY